MGLPSNIQHAIIPNYPFPLPKITDESFEKIKKISEERNDSKEQYALLLHQYLFSKIHNDYSKLICEIADNAAKILNFGNKEGIPPLLHFVVQARLIEQTSFVKKKNNPWYYFPKLLCKLGVDVNLVGCYSTPLYPKEATPLYIAAENIKNLDITKTLISYGGIAYPKLSKDGEKRIKEAWKEIFNATYGFRALAVASDHPEWSFRYLVEDVRKIILKKHFEIWRHDLCN